MKILHVIPSVSALHGGPSLAVRRMAETVASLGVEVDVATTTAHGRGELRVSLPGPLSENGVRYFYFRRQRPKSWTFSWPLTRWLAEHAGRYQLLHVHALFSYPTLVGCRVAKRRGIPYVLRPLGTLDPWALRFRRWKKTPYLWLFERQNLAGAAAIHAVSLRERRAIEALGLPVRAVTIPLGVDPPADHDPPAAHDLDGRRVRTGDGVVNVLFLSRLHPKKGIELLVDAVSILARRHPLRLTIAGDGAPAYVRQLRDRVAARGLHHAITFVGFVDGAAKWRLLRQADLFVLPSYDENFGMAVAEALSVGLPVVVSEHVALAEQVQRSDAGLVVPCDTKELAQAIATLVSAADLRRRLGEAGRQLARTEFAWPEVSRRLVALYEELVASPVCSDLPCGRQAV